MAVVEAPLRSEHRAGSLISSANVITDADARARWVADGIDFRADPCENSGFTDFCGPELGDDKAITNAGRLLHFDGFVVWEGDFCTAVATDIERMQARLTAKLARNTSHLVESQFSGVLAGNGGTGLVATTITGPLGFVPAFQALVEALNDDLGGDRGMIHVPQHLVPYLGFYGLLARPAGNVLQVNNSDHLVVAGTGYTGDGPATIEGGDPVTPDAGQFFIYATSPVEVRLTSISQVGGGGEVLNRAINQVEVRAERGAVAYFDRCAHYAVAVCLPDPGPACEAVS